MPREKQSTSYRLSPAALALVEELSASFGISHAGAIELALRQTSRWAKATSPGGLEDDLAEVKESEPPPTKRPRGRPRKGAKEEAETNQGAPTD